MDSRRSEMYNTQAKEAESAVIRCHIEWQHKIKKPLQYPRIIDQLILKNDKCIPFVAPA